MDYIIGLAGTLLVIIVLWDVMATTMLLSGAGPLTFPLTSGLWKICLKLHRRFMLRGFLSVCGGLIILASITVWIFFYWFGWTLIFSISNFSVLESQSGATANFLQRAYYVGFTFITLGIGDFKAGSEFWEILSIVLAISGFFMVTLVITYLLPVVSAVVEQRQLAVYIHSMGFARGGLIPSFQGLGLHGLIENLQPLTEKISRLGQQQLAYPVLRFMQSSNPKASLPLALANLDETLTLILHGSADLPATAENLLPLRHSLTFYLRILRSLCIPLADKPPPPLPLNDLAFFERQSVEADEFDRRLQALDERRRTLDGYVAYSGWEWQEVMWQQSSDEAEAAKAASGLH